MPEIAVIISVTSLIIALTTVNLAYRVKHNPRKRHHKATCQNCKGHHNG